MKLLLDTHVFLWLAGEGHRLSSTVRDVLNDPDNELFFSVVGAMEIAIKVQLGKLRLALSLEEAIELGATQAGIMELPIRMAHAVRLAELPMHHRDPFDRLLVAQAQVEKMRLLTADSQIMQYDVPVIAV